MGAFGCAGTGFHPSPGRVRGEQKAEVGLDKIRLALVQMNTVVGDVEGNLARMVEHIDAALAHGANCVLFPEMTLAGYPPEDLVFRRRFLERMEAAAQVLESYSRSALVVFGYASAREGPLANVAAVTCGGRRLATVVKQRLPNYGVFDEQRYFAPGDRTSLIEVDAWKIGISICEDLWYPDGPYLDQARAGGNLLLNISASPYSRGKGETRERMIRTRAEDTASYLAWVNLVGAQDELVFDGRSVVVGPDGSVIARAPAFEENILYVELDQAPARHRRWMDPRWRSSTGGLLVETVRLDGLPSGEASTGVPATAVAAMPDAVEELYRALVVGVRDYVAKTGFHDVVVGLSGGIDSAVTSVIAVAALGAAHVHTVFMPSEFSASESRRDAHVLAANVSTDIIDLPIGTPMGSLLDVLAPAFEGRPWDLTEENLQARIRGMLLMALSNKLGWLVLTTGNKSELATGYSTLYGDMAGGFAVLKDVLKRDVYRLAGWINREQEVIPVHIIERPPSAELRPDQKDEDSLPPYAILDPILEGYIEDDRTPEDLIALGYPPEAVQFTVRLVDRNEYKRRQAPVGLKVTPRAFGRDRRMPVAGKFR